MPRQRNYWPCTKNRAFGYPDETLNKNPKTGFADKIAFGSSDANNEPKRQNRQTNTEARRTVQPYIDPC